MALQPITVILSFTIHEDKREEFFQVALEEVKKIRAFKGNVHAYLSADAKNPNRLVMVELWENEALWLKFLQSDVVAKLSELAGTHTSNWDTQKLHLLSGLERISLEQVQEAQALSDAMWNKLKK